MDDTGQFAIPKEIPGGQVLTDREKALRDLFVEHYLVDFNATLAAQRCGFEREFAIEYARKFLEEPYVQQRILQLKFASVDPAKLEAYNKTRITNALLAEAHYRGPGSSHAARVSALAKLAAIHGMETPKKIEATIKHRGGVMAIPAIANIDDWEAAAAASQEQLVKDAKS